MARATISAPLGASFSAFATSPGFGSAAASSAAGAGVFLQAPSANTSARATSAIIRPVDFMGSLLVPFGWFRSIECTTAPRRPSSRPNKVDHISASGW